MKERKTCECCGAKLVEYRHGMSKGLARGLSIFFLAYGETAGEIGKLDMTYSQRCNFQKLRYWGVVEKIGKPDGKGGVWKVTPLGIKFLSGATNVPSTVWTYRAKVVEREPDGYVAFIRLIPGWQFRPQYAREAVAHRPGQGKLF